MTGSSKVVALLLPSLDCGGAERMALNLADAMVKLGAAVDLVLARAEGELLTQVPRGVGVVDLQARGVVQIVRSLTKYLRRRQPAGLISRMQYVNIMAAIAHKLARQQGRLVLIEDTHGSRLFNEGPLARRWRYALVQWPVMRRVYPWADAIVAVSRGVAADLAARLSVSEDSLHVIPNPVVTDELARLRAEEPGHAWLRTSGNSSGPSASEPVILAVGNLRPAKDYATLLHAFAILRKSIPARLIICGEGTERRRLEALRSELGLEACVQMPGHDPNAYAAMARASLLVLSSRREGSPSVLVEALACGCPVVATDCPSGPAEILHADDRRRLGLLATVGDPESLASAIEQCLATTWDAGTLREGVRMFDSRQAAIRYLELLGLQHHAAPASAERHAAA